MTKEKKLPLKREIHEIDATGKTVGRLSTQIAVLLRGKHKPSFEPHIDAGDFVVVKNASRVKFTGQKLTQKVYHHHSGYPGGLKTKKLSTIFAQDPSEVIRKSVLQMLPDIRPRKYMINRLTVTN